MTVDLIEAYDLPPMDDNGMSVHCIPSSSLSAVISPSLFTHVHECTWHRAILSLLSLLRSRSRSRSLCLSICLSLCLPFTYVSECIVRAHTNTSLPIHCVYIQKEAPVNKTNDDARNSFSNARHLFSVSMAIYVGLADPIVKLTLSTYKRKSKVRHRDAQEYRDRERCKEFRRHRESGDIEKIQNE